MLNLNAELNKSKFLPLMFNLFSCIGSGTYVYMDQCGLEGTNVLLHK